jgi:hypothetical protein
MRYVAVAFSMKKAKEKYSVMASNIKKIKEIVLFILSSDMKFFVTSISCEVFM